VTQAAVVCKYSLNPTSYHPPVEGGTSTFNINTAAGCRWTTSDVPAWITGIPASGTGTRTITFTVAPNTGPPRRNARIVIEGETFVVNQRKK
jgi:hypothetical protein